MSNKRVSFIAVLLSFVLVLAACGSEGSKEPGTSSDPAPTPPPSSTEAPKEATPPPVEEKRDPVELTFYSPNSGDLVETFMEQYGNAIEAKFPHVTIRYLHSPDTNPAGNLANLLAAQENIDVFMNADTNHYRLITPFKFEYDLDDLIRKHNYDLSNLEPSTVEAARALSKEGKLYALPYRMSVLSLMYNKDLFDKFGVDFPRDNMTWDEVYQLASTMTRKDGDVQYRGFITQSYNIAWMNQLSLGFADPETDKPYFYTDDRWQQFVQNINRFYEIPGNALAENSFRPINNAFFVDQIAAMYAYTIPATEQPVDWDLVTLPEFSHLPGVGSQAMLTLAYVPSISKHKDDAFMAIAYMTSDEFQTSIAKQALGLPIVKSQAVKDAYGQDNPFLQGKNLKALTLNSPASPFPQSPYQAITNNQLEKIWYQLGKGQMDINTALRTAAENAEKEIAALKDSGQ